MRIGSIEAGGTKFVCSVANQNLEVLKQISIPTKSPTETIQEVIEFFTKYPVDAIGVGAFGPIELDTKKDNYATILNTPKLLWIGFNYLEGLKPLGVPVFVTTDVNAAAYGEYVFDGKISSCTYFTVGTGVGGGFVLDGKIINGINHPEMGHIMIKRHKDDNYKGYCVYHDDCLEGLACGPSIEARSGVLGSELSKDHEIFDYIAYYLAQAAYNVTLIQAPERIIIGGGVLKNETLIDKVKYEFKKMLNDYVQIADLNSYIITPKLKDNAGTYGCLAFAKDQF